MKNRAEVVIAGNRFTMTGEQDEEYMTKIAALVDARVGKIRENGVNMMQAITLAACDIADSYVQAVQGAENLRTQISGYLSENKSLTQELADAREELDGMEKNAADRAQELETIGRLKERIAELEAQTEANENDRLRIEELEDKLSDAEKQMQLAKTDTEESARRVSELEQQVEANENDKLRIDELEGKLKDTEKQMQLAKADAEARARRVSELEQQAEVNEGNRMRINELEGKLSDAEKRMQLAKTDAEARARRVSELEQQVTEADARHRNDLEQAERRERDVRELREKAVDGEKMQHRIDELEKELASTERQLNEMRSRLSRLLK